VARSASKDCHARDQSVPGHCDSHVLPPPHFHAEYGEREITVDIQTGHVTGTFPRRTLEAVLEWCELNRQPLIENWQRATNREMLLPIPGLE
jgi:hypothetical protein